MVVGIINEGSALLCCIRCEEMVLNCHSDMCMCACVYIVPTENWPSSGLLLICMLQDDNKN